MKRYLLENKILLSVILILTLSLITLGFKYYYKVASISKTSDEVQETTPINDFDTFSIKNVLPSEGFATGLTYYPKLTWYNNVIKQKEPQADIDVSYPNFIGGASVQKLNQYIFNLVSKNIEEDRKLISVPSDDRLNNTIYLTSYYKVVGVKNGVVSIEIVLTDFTGGGNGNHDYVVTINWDLKSNRPLKNSELFCGKDYIEKLIPFTRKSIIKQFNDSDHIVHPLPADIISWVEEGTENKDNNWENFLIAENGLVAVFQPYQVTSGAGGVVRAFISYKDVPNLLCLP